MNPRGNPSSVIKGRDLDGRISRIHGFDTDPATRKYHAIWRTMLHRCENPKAGKYPYYGARGIKVCKRWHRFENFFADIGLRPSMSHTLGRKNNDGDYTPDNCRWENHVQQARNNRNNRVVSFRGQSKTVIEWSETTGINAQVLYKRLDAAWPVARALTQPIRKLKPRH